MEILKTENLTHFIFKAEADLEKIGLQPGDFSLFGNTDKAIIETLESNFKFVNMESGLTVQRDLTSQEIQEKRNENLNIIENVLPEEENKYLEIEAKLKAKIKDAKAELESYKTQSKELARCVRENAQDVQIKEGDVYRIAHNKHFIYLTVNNGCAIPIEVEEIVTDDLQKWDNGVNQEKSQAFFNQNNELEEAK